MLLSELHKDWRVKGSTLVGLSFEQLFVKSDGRARPNHDEVAFALHVVPICLLFLLVNNNFVVDMSSEHEGPKATDELTLLVLDNRRSRD